MNKGKSQILLLSLHLMLSGFCHTTMANAEVVPTEPVTFELVSDGNVSGTLSINGQSYPLKFIYTGKRDRDFEVLITNEPISYESMSKIFLELNVSPTNRKEGRALKGSSLKALYFTAPDVVFLNGSANASGRASFDEMLITSTSFVSQGSIGFQSVNFKDGIIKAKTSREWEVTVPGEDYQDIKIAAKYSLNFESKIREESLLSRSLSSENKALQAALANLSEPGNAQGTLTVSGRIIKLNHAYAMRQKKENLDPVMIDLLKAKPDEIITVLLTDKPVAKEYLAFSFDRSVPRSIHGLYLYINKTGGIRWSIIRYPTGRSGIAEEKAIEGFKLEKGMIRGTAENKDKRDGYAVSFEAPLKD